MVIDPADNVGTTIAALGCGTETSFYIGEKICKLRLTGDIPCGHKFALVMIPTTADIVKYGESIGSATADIPAGAHVHVHNTGSKRGRGDLEEVTV